LEQLAKDSIYNGEVGKLSPYISSTIRTRTALRRIDKSDLKGSKVYFGKKQFHLDELNMLMIINYFEENIYIDLQLRYKIDRWLIESFDERR